MSSLMALFDVQNLPSLQVSLPLPDFPNPFHIWSISMHYCIPVGSPGLQNEYLLTDMPDEGHYVVTILAFLLNLREFKILKMAIAVCQVL